MGDFSRERSSLRVAAEEVRRAGIANSVLNAIAIVALTVLALAGQLDGRTAALGILASAGVWTAVRAARKA